MMAGIAEFTPLNPEDFEVMKESAVLHVMRFADGRACVIERNPDGSNYDVGPFAPYHGMPMADAMLRMQEDGWSTKTTKQMIVTDRSQGYGHTTLRGVCSPDVTVEDIKARFYHSYFGGREAWVQDGKFGCVVHTD